MNWLDRTENEDDAMSSTSSVFILKSLSLFSHAQDFLDAANTYKINVLYLIAHARIESNNGTSELAKGAYVAATTEIILPMW